jgi:hypothetical protein
MECLTRATLSAKVAQLNSARFDNGGLPFDSLAFGIQDSSAFPDDGRWQGSNNSTASGMGLFNGAGQPR